MDYKFEQNKENATFSMTFSKSEWDAAVDVTYKKDSAKYKVPGFRAGKVPRGVIEKQYGDDTFYDGAVSELFSSGYRKILEEQSGFEPIDSPTIEFNFGDNGEVIITGSVDTVPGFELGKYTGLEVKGVKVDVTDKHVDEFINRMLQSRARQVEVQDKVTNGDIAVIDFVGSIDGVEFDGGKGTDYQLEIGSNSFIDTFEEQLIGASAGDKLDINVKFPQNYHATDLAGKPSLFKVTVNKVMRRELPQLDDKIVAEISQHKTVEEYRADSKKKLQENATRDAKSATEDALIQAVVGQTKIDVPQKMIDRQVETMLNDFSRRLEMQGLNIDGYVQYTGKSLETIRSEMVEGALNIIKTRLVFDAIARKHDIVVSESEVLDKAKSIGIKDKSQHRYLEQDMVFTKIVDFLQGQNKISY